MPVFDPIRRCLIVRVVYDGPAFGGKTTNLRQICDLFPIQKRTEMYTPGALKGRTMFFDWLELEAGRVGTQQLRCQLLTVPGQGERSYRRRPLLEGADGVVFVADCSQPALPATKKSFSQLRAQLRKRLPRRVPLMVQANKQDTEGALESGEVARFLRLGDETTIVPATAHNGGGVRDTVVAVLRAVVRDVQLQIAEHGIGAFTGSVETPDELFETILALEDEPPPLMEDDEDEEAQESPPSVIPMVAVSGVVTSVEQGAGEASAPAEAQQASAGEEVDEPTRPLSVPPQDGDDAETRPLPLSQPPSEPEVDDSEPTPIAPRAGRG